MIPRIVFDREAGQWLVDTGGVVLLAEVAAFSNDTTIAELGNDADLLNRTNVLD